MFQLFIYQYIIKNVNRLYTQQFISHIQICRPPVIEGDSASNPFRPGHNIPYTKVLNKSMNYKVE